MMATFSMWLLKLFGWTITGQLPNDRQFILIGAPHTSNWDFVIGILARSAVKRRIHFLGKHQLFIPPWGWLFRALGGTPVNRTQNNNLVQAVCEQFATRKDFALALAPEGTRGKVNRWKTGFYHIAVQAKVPIICVAFDYQHKTVRIEPKLFPSGNIDEDMNQILSYYRTIQGRYPKEIPDYTSD
ncbi:lysophospholipid acyltransferase family protein [Parashewanella tropica]|uniref:lysophospholipid acyltransferase family protein n=1 Tax=Parashewanella tropica TaxID=2547970 RepID=UPI003CCC71C7